MVYTISSSGMEKTFVLLFTILLLHPFFMITLLTSLVYILGSY